MKSIEFEYKNLNGERSCHVVNPVSLEFSETSPANKEWILHALDLKKNEKHPFLVKNIQRVFDGQIQRIFCVTVYVMNREGKFLMLLNKKLNKWVPAGGKIDSHETPDDAALRECLEETGVKIRLLGEKAPVEGGLIQPFGVQLNTIVPEKRDHVDFIYLGTPIDSETLYASEREADGIGWFTYEEVTKMHTFPSIIQWSEFFFQNRHKFS